MQSGDNEILKLMKRRYNKEFYRDLIYKLNDEIKDVGIGVDVITGFPGEEDSNFENTYNFLDTLPVSYLHVFNYSERKNTGAILLNGKVDVRKRKKRSELLRRLSERKKLDFYTQYSGTTQSVLFESKSDDGYIEGYTSNYIRVRSGYAIENEIRSVTLTEVTAGQKIIADCIININELNG